jgi:hypothetical protein
MFCIPSKKQILEVTCIAVHSGKENKAKTKGRKPNLKWWKRVLGRTNMCGEHSKAKPSTSEKRPPSPAFVEEPAPWVTGHRVFVVDKDGKGGYFKPKE